MYRFKVTVTAANGARTSTVYMFAASMSDVFGFFEILNPFLPVSVEQVGDAIIGLE